MDTRITRRRFLQSVPALSAGAWTLGQWGSKPLLAAEDLGAPIVLTSGDWPQVGDVAGPLLQAGAAPLDALAQGLDAAERSEALRARKAYLTNSDGVAELDALVMSGPAHAAGSVGALSGFASGLPPARRVMDGTRHVLLVEAGARRFALAQGLTEEEVPGVSSPSTGLPTVSLGVLALDAAGSLWLAVSGSDLPGPWVRGVGHVGAAAVVGSGGFVDNAVGGAVARGSSDVLLRFSCAYQAVEYMRRGMEPVAACNEVLSRIRAMGVEWVGGLAALRRDGQVGAVGTPSGFTYRVFSDGENRRLEGRAPWRPASGVVAPRVAAPRAAAAPADLRQASLPLVVTSWFPQVSEAVGAELQQGAHPLDAIVRGINVVEKDRSEPSVGAGNNVNDLGFVELDAAVMSGPHHAFASVAALQHIDVPICVARRLLAARPNTFLVGQGALEFALAQGFAYQESLLPKPVAGKPGGAPNPHDTVGVIVLDANRDLWVGMSTSGTGGKLAGRVGDSPLIGPGSYVDNQVGAATGTGVGEQIIKFAGSYQVVEYMRLGYPPKEAINFVLNRMRQKGYVDWVGFTAVNKDGEHAAVGMGSFTYHVFADGASTPVRSFSQYRVDVPVDTAVISAQDESLPAAPVLLLNYPNPFNSATVLAFSLAGPTHVQLTVYDGRGCVARRLLDEPRAAGRHHVVWDGCNGRGERAASGVYLCRLEGSGAAAVRKVTLLR